MRQNMTTRTPAERPIPPPGLVDRRHRHRQARPVCPPAMTTWVDSFDLWLSAEGKSKNTIRIYTDAVLRLGGWLATTDPVGTVSDWSEVTAKDAQRYLTWLLGTYSRGYANNQARALKRFWSWWCAEEGDALNPMARLSPPSLDDPVVPVIATDELAALIRDAEAQKAPEDASARLKAAVLFEARRDTALLRFLACTGVRLAECAGIMLDDLDVRGREALVTGKGNKQRRVKFDAKCATALDRYRRERAKGKGADRPELWLSRRGAAPLKADAIGKIVTRRGDRVGLHIYPHLFRHMFSHRWLDAGGAEGDLMELNGWESGEMLARYGRSQRSARARRAYDRIDVMGGI